MRSPAGAFDLRATLSDEIKAAIAEFDSAPGKPKAVHRCRVRLKRARALARVGRSCAPGLAAVFNDAARSVMQELATARDLAALAETARVLADKSGRKQAAALDALADQLDLERAAVAPLDGEAVRAALKDLLALAQVWPEPSERQLQRGAERLVRRARRAQRRGRRAEEPARRHQWRKREKDRFYAATLLDNAWPARRKRRLGKGEALGEALGHERDMLILIERVDAEPMLASDEKTTARARKALQARARRLARRADRLGEQLHAGRA